MKAIRYFILLFIIFIVSCDTECLIKRHIVKQDKDGTFIGFAREWEDLETCFIDYNSLSNINCYPYSYLTEIKNSLSWESYNDESMSSHASYMEDNLFRYMFFFNREGDLKALYLLKYSGAGSFKKTKVLFQ